MAKTTAEYTEDEFLKAVIKGVEDKGHNTDDWGITSMSDISEAKDEGATLEDVIDSVIFNYYS